MNNIVNVIKENPVAKNTVSVIAGLGAFVGAELILDGKLTTSKKSNALVLDLAKQLILDNQDKTIETK